VFPIADGNFLSTRKNKGNTPQYFPLITVQKNFRPRKLFEVVWLQHAIPPMRNAKKRTKKQFT
jgi:hypothetical protein